MRLLGASDAAVRPVEPAVRCGREIELTANLQIADKACFRCGCAKGRFHVIMIKQTSRAIGMFFALQLAKLDCLTETWTTRSWLERLKQVVFEYEKL